MTEHYCEDPSCGRCAEQRTRSGYHGTAAPTVAEDAPRPVTCPECGHRFALDSTAQRVTESREAMVSGELSYDDKRELVRGALRARHHSDADGYYCWVGILDLTDTEVVYVVSDATYQCSWSLAGRTVTLGAPVAVVSTYVPDPLATSDGAEVDGTAAETTVEIERARTVGRVLEAAGTDEGTGGRIYRVRIIAYGESKNMRRYPETVMRQAVPLYEGAKAYDRHRSDEDMRSGTIAGLVGHYRNVTAAAEGLEADLVLLPSAAHAAEALDASIAAQAEGLAPIVGISHDVYGTFRVVREGDRQLHEAVAITSVNSADIVSEPAAGGQAQRVVAGGTTPPTDAGTPSAEHSEENTVPAPTREEILAALSGATPEELAAAGLAHAPAPTTETTQPTAPAPAAQPTEATTARESVLGQMMIREAVRQAELPASAAEAITAALPEQIREADVLRQIGLIKDTLALTERAGLTPTAPTAQVTQEAREKKATALDNFFAGNYREGYRSFKAAFADITGRYSGSSIDADYNRLVLRETLGFYDSATRALESGDTTTWAQILGDSITRRMVAEYARPDLQTWRKIVSSVVAVNDFRTQRIGRLGGYGLLPEVAQGAPYQPLTTPGDEEATYAIGKKGGTEDLTMEMIANDDQRAIARIPVKLGLSAAQTLFRFVWDILVTNAATTYDSVALFHATHNNTDNPALLSQSTLSAGRRKMRQQTAYGDSSDVLSIIPKFLIVPSSLEEIAFQLCTSAVAIPATPAGPSNTPNLHQGLEPIILDYFADQNDWFLVADPSRTPTMELGFYQGREEPELFTQSDENVGAVFDADKITYKIRHVYGSAVLDHRGFYRGANA